MGFFSKFWGSKEDSEKVPVEPQAIAIGDFNTALSRHLYGELDAPLNFYLAVPEELPEYPLAQFFAAAIKAAKEETEAAVEMLRGLSRQIAAAGGSISHALIVELSATVSQSAVPIRIPLLADIVVSFGDQLKREGFLRESAVCYEIGVGLVPEHANVLHKLGDTLHDLREYDYAESVLLEALKYAPNHWGAIYTYAVLLQDLGRDEEAITYYEKAVRLNPDHAKCQNNYAAALLRTNRLEEALEQGQRAERLDRANPLVKVNLGNIYYLLLNYEKARSAFTEAIELEERLAPAHFGLAMVEQALGGDAGKAKEHYRKALEINHMIAEAHQALGRLLIEEGDGQGLVHLAAAAQINDNLKNVHQDLGLACLKLERREEALVHLKKALEKTPEDPDLKDLVAKLEAGSAL
jgi:tetratricopeptide (TPR) repeat protein